jgi:hypothetical protein
MGKLGLLKMRMHFSSPNVICQYILQYINLLVHINKKCKKV